MRHVTQANPHVMFRESSQEQGARTPGPGRQDVVKKLLRIRDEGTLETMQCKLHILQIKESGLWKAAACSRSLSWVKSIWYDTPACRYIVFSCLLWTVVRAYYYQLEFCIFLAGCFIFLVRCRLSWKDNKLLESEGLVFKAWPVIDKLNHLPGVPYLQEPVSSLPSWR